MKKLATTAAAALGLLALAGTAQAKEISSLKVCGASGCNTITDQAVLKDWEQGSTESQSQNGAEAQGFYTIELGFGDGQGNVIHRENAFWLPGSNLFRFEGRLTDPWWKASPNQVAMYQKAAEGLDAFTPDLRKVTVNGKPVRDPSSYMRLFGRLHYRLLPHGKLHFVKIRVVPAGTNPWMDGLVVLSYDAKRHLLIRPDGYFKLPASLGRLVLHRASLRATTSGSGGGRTALYAGLGVSGAVALAVLGLARRKKMH